MIDANYKRQPGQLISALFISHFASYFNAFVLPSVLFSSITYMGKTMDSQNCYHIRVILDPRKNAFIVDKTVYSN